MDGTQIRAMNEAMAGPRLYCEYCGKKTVLSPCWFCMCTEIKTHYHCRGCGKKFCENKYKVCQKSKKTSTQEELILAQQQLKKDPFDYDAINLYVEAAYYVDRPQDAIAQLWIFAKNLDQKGRIEEAIECCRYIWDLKPEDKEAEEYIRAHDN